MVFEQDRRERFDGRVRNGVPASGWRFRFLRRFGVRVLAPLPRGVVLLPAGQVGFVLLHLLRVAFQRLSLALANRAHDELESRRLRRAAVPDDRAPQDRRRVPAALQLQPSRVADGGRKRNQKRQRQVRRVAADGFRAIRDKSADRVGQGVGGERAEPPLLARGRFNRFRLNGVRRRFELRVLCLGRRARAGLDPVHQVALAGQAGQFNHLDHRGRN